VSLYSCFVLVFVFVLCFVLRAPVCARARVSGVSRMELSCPLRQDFRSARVAYQLALNVDPDHQCTIKNMVDLDGIERDHAPEILEISNVAVDNRQSPANFDGGDGAGDTAASSLRDDLSSDAQAAFIDEEDVDLDAFVDAGPRLVDGATAPGL
jgi:hypothetical protein